jgi:YVTN family beta-propeller protein
MYRAFQLAIAVGIGSGTTAAILPAQGPVAPRLTEIQQASRSGNHQRALSLADSLGSLLPDDPDVVRIRAVALASAGRTAEAAALVRQILGWDARFARQALEDSAMAAVRAELRPLDIDGLAARADIPVARARVWAILAERDLIPEGTAWDPATSSVLVGSLNKHKVVAIAPDGTVTDRVPRGSGGVGSVAGIHVDSTRGILWVTSNARYDQPADTTPSALFEFDAATGRFRAKYPVPGPGSFLNDMTTGPDGTVYLTDSRRPRIWTLPPGGRELKAYEPAGTMLSANGITISADGRHLFLADADRVKVIPLAGGPAWRLAVPDTINISWIDGLAFSDGALIAHHPLDFWRVARYQLDPARRAVTGREVYERNTPDSRTATTGEIVGADYVFIGNGQLDRMNAGTIDSATMEPVRMYRIPLRPRPQGLVAVSLSGRDSVVLFDPQSLERRATFAVGNNPHEIAASADGRRAYVANAGDTSISVLETGTAPRVVATWGLPDSIRVHDVAIGDDGTVWAASGERQMVLEIDPASGAVRRRFPIERPGGWMIEAGGPDRSLVVGNLEGGAVTLLNPTTGLQRAYPAEEGEIDAGPSRDGRQIWSVNMRSGTITVFDSRNGAVLGRLSAGSHAGRVTFTPDGRTALVVNTTDSTIVAFDVRTRQRTGSVTVAGGPKVIALSRDGRRGYISHPERGWLTLLDVPSLRVLHGGEVPGTPDGVAVLEPLTD